MIKLKDFLFVCLCAVALISGCQTMKDMVDPGEAPKVDQSLPAPIQAAQQAINEANLDITAAANIVKSNAKAGVTTKAEALEQVGQLRNFREQIKAAQVLLDAGDISNAQTQTKLVNTLLTTLQKKVAEEARKAK
jgi:hypothetical protein